MPGNGSKVRFCESGGVKFPPATHLAVLVHGTEDDVDALREEIAQVLSTMGLRLSQAKTRVVHMSDEFDFLGFHIQWRRKRGSSKWHVYTFIADRPVRVLKAKIRAATTRTSAQDPGAVLTRLGQIMRGWSNYFRHAVAKHTFGRLAHFVWWRVARWLRRLHRWGWKDFRRRFTTGQGQWRTLSANGIELFNLEAVPVTRYRWRGKSLEHLGPITRTVADAALLMSVLAGPDPRDRHSLPAGDVAGALDGADEAVRGRRNGEIAQVGLQIVRPHLADGAVLAASAAFERARPWADQWPSTRRW